MKSLMVLSVICLFSSSAFAKPAILAKFKLAYPNAKVLYDCTTCHANTDDYERNAYGQDVENNNLNFKAIEGLDSDADGFTNIVEINAGTQPGDKDSHPAQ